MMTGQLTHDQRPVSVASAEMLMELVDEVQGLISAGVTARTAAEEITIVLHDRGWVGFIVDDVKAAMLALSCRGKVLWGQSQA